MRRYISALIVTGLIIGIVCGILNASLLLTIATAIAASALIKYIHVYNSVNKADRKGRSLRHQ